MVITPGKVRFTAPEAAYGKLDVSTKAIRGGGACAFTLNDTMLN